MNLKELESNSYSHAGWGAGSGTVYKETYECPCGKGTVTYEKDDIPGFKDKTIYCNCESCKDKYNFGRGTATEK